jgi:hypothetical protein
MIIRKEQDEALREEARHSYECRVFAHLQRVWPRKVEEVGEPASREWIRSGMAKAETYGVETEYDVCRYVDLMFALGPAFDTDPAYPWAARILRDEDLDGTTKMDRLYERTESELQAPADSQ